MIKITTVVSPPGMKTLAVEIGAAVKDTKALNGVLAYRVSFELKGHFHTKRDEPNKRKWEKTGFYSEVSRGTGAQKITQEGAVVSITDPRFRMHYLGGTIRPTGGRKWLTIPLVEEARGLSVRDYEHNKKRLLFRLPGSRVLVEKPKGEGDRTTVFPLTARHSRKGVHTSIALEARQPLRAVYALARQAVIKPNPSALPTDEKMQSALWDEVSQYIARPKNLKPGQGK